MPKSDRGHYTGLYVQVHRVLKGRLDAVSKQSGRSRSEIVSEALAKELDAYEKGFQRIKEERAPYG